MAKEVDIDKMRETRKKKKQNKRLIMLISLASVLLIAVVTAFVIPVTYAKIYKNVSVAGVSLGGLTQEEAYTLLSEKFSEFIPEISVNANDTTKKIDFNIIAEYNIEETAKTAFEYGRRNIFTKFYTYYFDKKDLPLETIVNKDALIVELTEFQNSLDGGYVDTSFKIDDDILIVTAGKSGNTINVETLTDEILTNLKSGENVEVDAQITLKEYSGIDIDKLYEDVFCQPQDAYYDEENSKLITHKNGYSFDKTKAETILKDAKEGEEYKIQLSVTYPEITEEALTGKMFSDTLASYSTKYNPGEVNRTHNMYLASSKVNGTVISPGEVFSYNGIVGERTVAKGYRNAKIFENGQVVDGLAGGICQVSTTIYNAALYSNMEIVERKNHSFPVSYAPMGQDATVVMGSIDFRFKNNTGYPIKIVSSVSGGLCTVTILGTDKNHYKIEIQNTVTGTKARPVEYENDPSLEPGVEKEKQSGSDGYTIASRRIVRKNGEIVKNEAIPSSYYIPLKKIILRNEETENPEEQLPEGETENPEDTPSDTTVTDDPLHIPTAPSDDSNPANNPDNEITSDALAPADTPSGEPMVDPSAEIPEITPEADPNTGV